MKRLLSVLALSAIGLTACGGGSDSIQSAISSASSVAAAASSAVDAAAGSAADCAAVYTELTGALVAGMAPGAVTDFEKVFANTEAAVPDELKDDVKVLAGALVELGKQMQANPNDPAVMQQMVTALSSAEVQQASDALNAYFGGGCQ